MSQETDDTFKTVNQQIEQRFAAIRARVREFEDSIRPVFDSKPQSKPCDSHPQNIITAEWDKTVEKSWPDRKLVMIYSQCPECEAEKAYQRTKASLSRMGIPRKLSEATFEAFETGENECLKTALSTAKRQAAKKKGFILLLGPVGSGKSHLAASAIRKTGAGRFVTHGGLIQEIRDTYNPSYTGMSREEIVTRYQETPCLALDELGIRIEGKDEEYILYTILAHRYDRDLLTAITSNLELSEIEQVLGDRLIDRMAEDYTVINLDVQSHRRSEQ